MKHIFTTDEAEFDIVEVGDDFLAGNITVSRTGVFDYFVPDAEGVPQLVKKAKLPEDLFSRANLDSIDGAPITDGHPMEDGKPVLVDSTNYNQYVKGAVSSPRVEGDKILAKAKIYDKDLIADVISKDKRQSSIGFEFDEDSQGGTYQGESYEAVQRHIMTNHVAQVEAGRAGPEVGFHVDMKEEGIMPKWRTRDNKDIEIDAANASVIHGELTHYKTAATDAEGKLTTAGEDAKTAKTQIDGLNAEIVELKKQPAGDEAAKVTKLEGEKQAIQDKLDLATKKLETAEGDLKKATDAEPKLQQERVDRRVALQADAKAFGIDDCTGMDDRQVMEQVIQAGDLAYPEGENIGDKKDEAIDDRYKATVERKRETLNSDEKAADGSSTTEVAADVKENKQKRLNMAKDTKGGK